MDRRPIGDPRSIASSDDKRMRTVGATIAGESPGPPSATDDGSSEKPGYVSQSIIAATVSTTTGRRRTAKIAPRSNPKNVGMPWKRQPDVQNVSLRGRRIARERDRGSAPMQAHVGARAQKGSLLRVPPDIVMPPPIATNGVRSSRRAA